ncbi:hypothetical protein K431DRAFT_269611 [Polychaeton citri CBS 116435]|uniref:Uncharacterized protein n=1 Tax=Polychaeton citri CBS 116435 TaxID=1314669 RepID=A0A9P4UNT5_9PEZI|nr:hypothetical protein K431DRAFT_269611 [Polychaeton citri CBS 116435]
MSAEFLVHVVSKANIADHFVVPVNDIPSPPLTDGAVRVRPLLLGVTANTLTYAAMGGPPMYWWDAYPVPSDLQPPYNDRDLFGIVPTWGYAEVVESCHTGIGEGMLIWGFWPTTMAAVDLKLAPSAMEGHYIEVSEHRNCLFNLYQRYQIPDAALRRDQLDERSTEVMAWKSIVYGVSEAGFLLNNFILGNLPVHPMGGGRWTSENADLSSAVVVSLGASGKTARAFHDSLIADRGEGSRPQGLLAVTAIATSNLLPDAPFKARTVAYSDVDSKDVMAWISQLHPSKAVIIDFGSRGDSLYRVNQALQSLLGKPGVTIIGVGGEPKVRSKEEAATFMQQRAQFENRVQMNATGVRDSAMKELGEEVYFQRLEGWYKGYTARGNLDSMELEIGHGIDGPGGLSKCWTTLCEQETSPSRGMAFRMV